MFQRPFLRCGRDIRGRGGGGGEDPRTGRFQGGVPVNKVISARSHLRRPASDGRTDGKNSQRSGSPTGLVATALPRAYSVARAGRQSEKLNNGGKFGVFDRDSPLPDSRAAPPLPPRPPPRRSIWGPWDGLEARRLGPRPPRPSRPLNFSTTPTRSRSWERAPWVAWMACLNCGMGRSFIPTTYSPSGSAISSCSLHLG